MNPEEARDLLEGTTPGPWGHYLPRGKDGHYDPVFGDVPGDEIALVKRPADWHLIAAAPTLAAMIAGMRTEYRTEEWQGQYPGWVLTSPWTAENPAGGTDPNIRIVRRYVTTEEEA